MKCLCKKDGVIVMEYPDKIKKELEKTEFFDMTDEEKIQKHKESIKKFNKLNSEDKKLLLEIIEENNID